MEVSHKRHERGTTGDSQFKGTKGVQLATASSMASSVCRGDAPVLAQRYKRLFSKPEMRGDCWPF